MVNQTVPAGTSSIVALASENDTPAAASLCPRVSIAYVEIANGV